MISVQEAQGLISENVYPLSPIRLLLHQLCGHVLAEDVFSHYDIPAFRQSSMDGYAFSFDKKLSELILVGEMAAGTGHHLEIKYGETSRIFTGAPLPEGADTVVMQEKIDKSDNRITLDDPQLSVGKNVREKGSEIRAGELAMQKGDLIGPAAIGFLAGIGITEAEVYPMPKVAIILTGNELKQPGTPLDFGQVYESNSYSLSAAMKIQGITDIELFWVVDEIDKLTDTLSNALVNNDVVLLTGGVSVGDYDFVIEASKNCGIEQIFHKVRQKPGKPLFFGTRENKLIFGLPGNPSSVLSCYYNYVLPALAGLACKENSLITVKASLSFGYQKPAGLAHFLKGIYENGMVRPLNAQESYRLSSFAQSNCLICLSETQQTFNQGEGVDVLLLPQ
ncbi:molybdopterin molybdenumtransferase MoeA [Pedobacter frigidisoli]|uniref:Molybdopterin molybdenumtransferase n=1 Tax=Pedobacter frigidisoli TaxID=2530455 RepID=A0A4R0P5A2_9SPHI|nr:gephyrin-like molybdotransferase Glp [Pedobacter frigidisoli]TCD07603.1 molybdopterin molybdenumtransferase MoeA [Pedobacter frigidisoli]